MKRILYSIITLIIVLNMYGQGVEIISDPDNKNAYEQKSYFVTGNLKLEEGFSINASSALNGEFFAKTPDPRDLVTTWKTDNPGKSNSDQIKIYLPYGPHGSIEWINVNKASMSGAVGPIVWSVVGEDFPEAGTYIVVFSNLYRMHFEYDEDAEKLLSIIQWGSKQWLSLERGFAYCKNLEILANDIPNISAATDLSHMFLSSEKVDFSLANWDISGVVNMKHMLAGTNLSQENYDATLQGWATLDPEETQIPTGISLGATGLEFCAGETARTSLINDYGWTITGDAKNCSGARLEDVVLSDEEENAQLVVYPNPANDYLQIVDQDLIGASVSIYDLKGKVQFHESNVINTQMNIDVYHLATGTYLLKIEKDGNVSERKIIIQH